MSIRKLTVVCFVLTLSWSLSALSGEFKPYTAEKFSKAQSEGKTVVLDFKASWCGTCKKQGKVLNKIFNSEPSFSDFVLLEVNYDDEKVLKRQMKVRKQSTIIVFKGNEEVGRSTGDTNMQSLKSLIAKGA